MTTRQEWKCGCGTWLPMGLFRHPHIENRAPTLPEMLEARRRGADATGDTATITYETWTPEHERRTVPDEQ